MIPLKDIDRSPSRFPAITSIVIAVNLFVFLLELANGSAFVKQWSFVPSDLFQVNGLVTMVTAMFLHGGLLHIAGNMIFFWAFGPEVEEMMGRTKFAAFYLLGGLVAFGAQVMLNPDSRTPMLGASGAIAAVMGAFLVTFPRDRIRSLVFLGFFVTVLRVRAFLLVGLWFFLQIISEADMLAEDHTAGGVAYAAHIGGFIFGLAFARLFEGGRTDGQAGTIRWE